MVDLLFDSKSFWYLMCCFINTVYLLSCSDDKEQTGLAEVIGCICLIVTGFIGTALILLYWLFFSPVYPPRTHTSAKRDLPSYGYGYGYEKQPKVYQAPKKKVEKPKTKEEKLCFDCKKFDHYKLGNGRNPNNCNNWLCEEGKCPHEDEILQIERDKMERRSKKKAIFKECQCYEHLGKGSNLKCPVHGECVEELFGTKKNWFKT